MREPVDWDWNESLTRRVEVCLAAYLVLLAASAVGLSWPMWLRLYTTSCVLFMGLSASLWSGWALDMS
jgi:hypothetical protein